MDITLVPMTGEDRKPIIDIFNYYVENTFAAYPAQPVPYEFYHALLNLCEGYPAVTVKDADGHVLGFGMLRPFHPVSSFSQTAEITYFVKPDYTGKGIGRTLLEYLVVEGHRKNLTSILASVSSLNEGSINFHLKNGFEERGRLREAGRKKGRAFDVVYFQRML